MGLKVNKRELAEIVGRSQQALTEWQRQGMPMEAAGQARGQPNTYDTARVIEWMIARDSSGPGEVLDLNTERARLAKEQADKTALENSVRRGELIPAHEVTHAWTHAFAELKTRLLALPTRLAPLVLGCSQIAQAQETIDVGVRDALSGLASRDDGVFASVGTAEEIDGERVGGPGAEAESGGERGARAVEH